MNKLELIKNNAELTQFYEQFKNTLKKYISIKATFTEQETKFTQSKFAGNPYLIDINAYPYGSDGNPLMLLAQINFAETPHLDNFPKDGLLQIYISYSDKVGLLGANFDKPTLQDLFRIIYFPANKVDEKKAIRDFQFSTHGKDYYFPVTGEFRLEFELEEDIIPFQDHRFNTILGKKPHKFDISKEALDELYKIIDSDGHKIGGYPYFTQWDPRDNDNYRSYDTLLFQMTSQYEEGSSLSKPAEIMWGDMGVANFFIKSEKLAQLDFSDVLYSW